MTRIPVARGESVLKDVPVMLQLRSCADSGYQGGIHLYALDLADDGQVGDDGEQRGQADEDECVLEGAGALAEIADDGGRGPASHVTNEVEESAVQSDQAFGRGVGDDGPAQGSKTL